MSLFRRERLSRILPIQDVAVASHFFNIELVGAVKKILVMGFFLSTAAWAKPSLVKATKLASLTSPTSLAAPLDVKEDSSSAKYKGSVRITTLGRSVQDESLKSTVGWAFAAAGMSAEYFDWLTFRFGLLGVFGEGAAQNYLNDEGNSANAIVLDTASLEIKPVKQLTLSAGVIGYKINPLLTTMTPGTSLGSEQKLELQNDKETFKFSVIGSEMIPSLGLNRTVVEQNTSPYFLAGTAIVENKFEPISSTVKLAATSFRFGNLPSTVAKGALTAGNSLSAVSGLGDNLQFVIGFAGTESAAVFETVWSSSFKTTLKGVYIRNDRAFENENQGRMGRFEIEWKKGNLKYTTALSVFEVEADVTPAVFTILANRMNNRRGLNARMEVELIKQKIAFAGSYAKYKEIESTPFLSDREVYNLGLEVNYDLFK